MYKLLLMLVSKNCSWNMFWKEDQRICQILPINFWKKNVSEGILGKIVRGFLLNDQNLLSMAKVTCCGSLSDWLFSLEFKGYLEKFILSPDVMLQLLKKLKLYSKLGPDTVHKAPISFHIKTYLWSLVD